VSHFAIDFLPLTPAPFADCPYLDRCNRALTFGCCASCRFHFASFFAEGCHVDFGSHRNFVAISWSEAAR